MERRRYNAGNWSWGFVNEENKETYRFIGINIQGKNLFVGCHHSDSHLLRLRKLNQYDVAPRCVSVGGEIRVKRITELEFEA